MKCKKIMALALAGMLAVGMLAGCGEKIDPARAPLDAADANAYLETHGVTNLTIEESKDSISEAYNKAYSYEKNPDLLDKNSYVSVWGLERYGNEYIFLDDLTGGGMADITLRANNVYSTEQISLTDVHNISEYTAVLCAQLNKGSVETVPYTARVGTVLCKAAPDEGAEEKEFWVVYVHIKRTADWS